MERDQQWDLRLLCALGGPLTMTTVSGLVDLLGEPDERRVTRRLRRLRSRGLVRSEMEGPRRWWVTTEDGRDLLAAHDEEVARRLRVREGERIRLRSDGRYELSPLTGPRRLLSDEEVSGALPIHPEPALQPARRQSLTDAIGRR